MSAIRQRRSNQEIRGQIFQFLLDQGESTSALATLLNRPYGFMCDELMLLHHLGIIQPIAVVEGSTGTFYERDLVWELTEHGLSHNVHIPDCRACKIREHLLTFNVGE